MPSPNTTPETFEALPLTNTTLVAGGRCDTVNDKLSDGVVTPEARMLPPAASSELLQPLPGAPKLKHGHKDEICGSSPSPAQKTMPTKPSHSSGMPSPLLSRLVPLVMSHESRMP